MISILQIANKAPFPADDGSSIAIYNMATGFLKNKVSLNLLVINTKKHFKSDENVPAGFRIDSNYQSIFRNTNTTWYGALLNLFFSSKSYFVSRFYFSGFRRALETKLKEKNFDIVQLEGLFMATYIPLIRKYSQAKIVLRSHNVEHLIWERHISGMQTSAKKWYLRLQNKRLKSFELNVIKAVDAIVPISSVDERMLKVLSPMVPMHTCITGVDVNEYIKHQNQVRSATVFYFGSMDWLPNQEAAKWFLEKCWKKILTAVPEARFVIAGKSMPLEFFHIVEPNVQIIENVESSADFFTSHEVMIVPLLSGSGLRIKIVEGMSYGKAIVSTSIGAEGIEVTSGQEMLIADDADAFTEAVISLLKDKKKRNEIGQTAFDFASQHFDNAAVVAQLVQFYKQILND